MKLVVISFSILITCILILFQLAKFSHMRSPVRFEWWIAIFSLLFMTIGILITRSTLVKRPKTKPGETTSVIDQKQLQKLNLSNREYEVLKLINEGLSNQQIADRLFISENTIKKHVSNLFIKMDVERRTEALKKAKELNILN